MKNEVFMDYIFYYNPYEEAWYAFKREDYLTFFNNRGSKEWLKSKKIKDLFDYISKVKGK